VGVNEPRGAQLSTNAQGIIFTVCVYVALLAAMWFFTDRLTRSLSKTAGSVSRKVRKETDKANDMIDRCTNLLSKALDTLETEPLKSALKKADRGDGDATGEGAVDAPKTQS
jgi:hypothetical protein